MRNLKKILAMVLALVMSLSLMATAGASSFPDVDDDNPYATAIEVLDELKVFQGYKEDGTFRPTETLNRAQAAVLVYRIATGDVEDKYLDNYTYMQQSKFTDLDGYNWAKGYINYCQNAGIVVGTTATTFDPGAKVTGYQLLVMLLRTLGYGKAGEFADPKGWELQTASIAEREGITENVTTGDFGAPAPRQMVAEILFRGLLTETVEYSPLTPNGYTKSVTLGKRELGLEEITGVVVANEFADLYGTSVLAEGKTQVKVEGEDKTRTLNYGTLITDIGESRLIYTQNTSKVLYLADTGDNVVKEYGEGVNISSATKFAGAAEMNQVAGTEFFVNFSTTGYYTSDYRIEYVINFTKAYDGWDSAADYIADGQGGQWTDSLNYRKIIPAGDKITIRDYNNMRRIFVHSNGLVYGADDGTGYGVQMGKVFVGTQTKDDISDTESFVNFEAKYLKPIAYAANWSSSVNGDWVKFIDNNNDGDCEYAFLTTYWLDEVISTYKKSADDENVMQYNAFKDSDATRYMDGAEAIERNVAVGDIVLAAKIDGQYLVSKPDSVTTTATSYNYKTNSITAGNGETYTQSGIDNATDMQDQLSMMAPKTEYEIFLDKFGFARAYRQPGGTQYALVTELYYSNNNNGSLVQNWPMTVELAMPDEDGKVVYKEYNLSNVSGNPFVALNNWTLISNAAMTSYLNNWLQPATAHLGIPSSAVAGTNLPYEVRVAPGLTGDRATYWPANLQVTRGITTWGVKVESDGTVVPSGEFNYKDQLYRNLNNTSSWTAPQEDTVSFTNVAVVGIDGDNASLNSAARLNRGSNGIASSYAVDYIQLTLDRPAKGAASYKAEDASYYNQYVNADKDTEIYIAYNGGVQYFKGYANMPALTESLVGRIHAAYAVARNTNTGVGAEPYWMADVIVYEVEKWDDLSKASISLAYYTALQQLQTVNGVTVNTLNSKTDPAKVDLVPSGMSWGTGSNWWGDWGSSWKGYGFYQLYNTTDAVDGVMTARKIEAISKDFNAKGIYAGIVTEEVATAPAGYIPVNMDRDNKTTVNGNTILATDTRVSITDAKVYSITGDNKTNDTNYYTYTDAENLQFSNVRWSEVKAGDLIIWVGGADTTNTTVSASSFIVDLGNPVKSTNPLLHNYDLWEATPSWLGGGNVKAGGTAINNGLWSAIMGEQEADSDEPETITIKFKYEAYSSANDIEFLSATKPATQSVTVGKGTAVTLDKATKAYFDIAGWTVAEMTAKYSDDTAIPAGSGSVPSYGTPAAGQIQFAKDQTTKDITVTVKYNKAPASLTATITQTGAGDGTTIAPADITWSIPAKGTTGTLNASNQVPGAAYGDVVYLSWDGAAHEKYVLTTATDGDVKVNGVKLSNGDPIPAPATGNRYSISVEVKAAVTLTINAAAVSPISITGANGNGVSTWGATDPVNVYTGDTFTIGAPTVDPGYKITSVYWTDDAGVTQHPMTEVKNNSGVVTGYKSAATVGTKPVTVYAVTEKTTAAVSFGSTDITTIGVTVAYTNANDTAATASISSLGDAATNIKKGTNVTLTFTDPTAAWVVAITGAGTANQVNNNRPISGNGTQVVNVQNITEDVCLIVFDDVDAYNAYVASITK